MTTHDAEQALAERDSRGPVRPGEDRPEVRLHRTPGQETAARPSQQAWSARVGLMGAATVLALGCLFALVGRLDGGTAAGIVAYGAGLAFAAPGVEFARRGRTRWAMMAIIVAAVSAALGSALP